MNLICLRVSRLPACYRSSIRDGKVDEEYGDTVGRKETERETNSDTSKMPFRKRHQGWLCSTCSLSAGVAAVTAAVAIARETAIATTAVVAVAASPPDFLLAFAMRWLHNRISLLRISRTSNESRRSSDDPLELSAQTRRWETVTRSTATSLT